MKKLNFIVIALIILISFVSFSVLTEGVITISSKGKAHAESDGTTVRFWCDNTDTITCTIEIKPPVN